MNISWKHTRRISAASTTTLLVLGVTALAASAHPDPGEAILSTSGWTHDRCALERVGTEFVRCDYLTGNGVPAPGWVPTGDVPGLKHDPGNGSGSGALKHVLSSEGHVTTSGSAGRGFAWSSGEHLAATVECDAFDARVVGDISDRFTVSFDSEGDITGFTESVSAPRLVWTNTRSGASIMVRADIVRVANHVPGSQRFARSATRSTQLVNHLGEGLTIEDVDRVVDEPTRLSWRDLSGESDLAHDLLTEPRFCAGVA